MKKIIKEFIPYVIIILVVIVIRSFLVTPVQVVGSSMYPTLKDGEVLILNKVSYKMGRIKRNDIIVTALDTKDPIIKRVIGLPGESIHYRNKVLYINGVKSDDDFALKTADFDIKELGYSVIPDNMYLVLGDNRGVSKDSRTIGLIAKEKIDGKALIRIWPLNKIGTVK